MLSTTYEASNVLLLNKKFPGRLGIPRAMYIIYTSQAKGPGADPGIPSCPSLHDFPSETRACVSSSVVPFWQAAKHQGSTYITRLWLASDVQPNMKPHFTMKSIYVVYLDASAIVSVFAHLYSNNSASWCRKSFMKGRMCTAVHLSFQSTITAMYETNYWNLGLWKAFPARLISIQNTCTFSSQRFCVVLVVSVISVSPPSSLQSWQLRHEHGSVTCHHLQSPLIWSIKGDGFAISTKPERNETAGVSRVKNLDLNFIQFHGCFSCAGAPCGLETQYVRCYHLLCYYDLPYTTKKMHPEQPPPHKKKTFKPNPPRFWEIGVPIIEVVMMEMAGSLGEHLILGFYWLIHRNVR